MHNTLLHTPNKQRFRFGNYANIEINTFAMSKFGSFMNFIDYQQISDVSLLYSNCYRQRHFRFSFVVFDEYFSVFISFSIQNNILVTLKDI